MRSLFDLDSPLMNGLGKVFDCIALSICFMIASLPIVTMGLACGALYRAVYRSIRRDEGRPVKVFWETFKANLKPGLLNWLPILAAYALLIAEALILRGMIAAGQPGAKVYGIVLVLIALVSVWAAYCTAYTVRFNGTFKEVLWLSFYLVLAHPLMTIVILLFQVLGCALGLLVPFLVLFLPAGICMAISFPMESVFLKHMRPEDAEKTQIEQ